MPIFRVSFNKHERHPDLLHRALRSSVNGGLNLKLEQLNFLGHVFFVFFQLLNTLLKLRDLIFSSGAEFLDDLENSP